MKTIAFLMSLLFVLALPVHGQGGAGDAFERGNTAFAAGQNAQGEAAIAHFREAMDAYAEALESGDSWVLHYNMGNAAFRAQEYGLAALHFERALALNPEKAEIRANLELTRKTAGLPAYREESLPERWAVNLPLWAWTVAATVLAWCLLALIILPPLFRGYGVSSLGAALLCAVLLGIAGYGLYGWHLRAAWEVVVQADAPLLSAPAEGATPLRYLNPATAVKPERSVRDWVFVRSEQGDEGWLRNDLAEPVWHE